MRRLRFQNPVLDKNYRAFIGSDYASGTSVTVLNNASFAANDYLVFGEPTAELTEGKQLSSISGSTTLTLASTLNFAHSKGTTIYKSPWDFISIESRSSSAGVFAVISTSPIQWDNKLNETVYFDASGTDNYQYRFRYYNSITATFSEYSPTLSGSGFTKQQVGYMIRNIRKIVGDIEKKIVTDDEIIRFFNTAQDIINAHNPRYWFLKVDSFNSGTGIAAVAGTSVYSLASYTTLDHLSTLRYRYTSGSTDVFYHLQRLPEVEFDSLVRDRNQPKDNWPMYYKILPPDSSSTKGYIQVYPNILASSLGTLYPNYYQQITALDSVDDSTLVPLPVLLEDYAIGMIEKIKGNESKAGIYLTYLESSTFGSRSRTFQVMPKGLEMLDAMDAQQNSATDQPQNLVNFRGRRGVRRLYGERYISTPDYIRENYF